MVDDGLSQKVATLAGAGISMNSLWSVHRELADGSLLRVLPEDEINAQSSRWLVLSKIKRSDCESQNIHRLSDGHDRQIASVGRGLTPT